MRITHRLFPAAAICIGLLFVASIFAFLRKPTAIKPATTQHQIEVERVTLQEWGIEPKEINREVGPFVLVVENHSGLNEVEVSLTDESGNGRRRIPVTKNALTSKQRLELPPGTYLIKEAGHSDWECKLTISHK